MLPEVSSTKEVLCGSIEELDTVVNEIRDFSDGCLVWLLDGELGSGKTTLVKSICHSLGVEDNVNSPTFSIINEYRDRQGHPVYHFDFYRIKELSEAVDLGLEEYLNSGNLCLMEWPSLIEPVLPETNLRIQIEVRPDDSRVFHLTRNG